MLRSLRTCSALAAVIAIGCSEPSESVEADPVERRPIPESQFKPGGLEDTVEVLAGELDRAAAAELRLGVALGSDRAAWELVQTGVERAFAELGAQGGVEAANESDQADFVKHEREAASNGIALVPLASSLKAELQRARDGGIPVVTIEHDVASERDLFVGFGQYEFGQRLGDVVAQATDLRVGNVIVLGADDEAISQVGYLRAMGAKSVMEEVGFSVVIRNSSDGADGEVLDVETLKQDLLAQPRPLAVLGVLETSYRIALAAQAAEGALAGDQAEPTGRVRLKNVPFVAYGSAPATLDALRDGWLHATVIERRHYMGYLVPYALAGFSLLGTERTKYLLTPHLLDDGTLDVGVDVVRSAELDAYREFQEQLVR